MILKMQSVRSKIVTENLENQLYLQIRKQVNPLVEAQICKISDQVVNQILILLREPIYTKLKDKIGE